MFAAEGLRNAAEDRPLVVARQTATLVLLASALLAMHLEADTFAPSVLAALLLALPLEEPYNEEADDEAVVAAAPETSQAVAAAPDHW